jgi:hypothetical protein
MKKMIVTLLLLSIGSIIMGQTTLSAGDIAIVAYASVNPDEISFVCLVNIEAGTSISFTDNGWKSNNTWRGGEGTHVWTASSNCLAGDVINILLDGPQLATTGDQVIAYQGSSSEPTFIFALNSEGTGWQSDASSTNESALPTGLTNGTNAIALDEVDNAYYNGSTIGTKAELLSLICNKSNWLGSNSRTNFDPSEDGPTSFTVTDSPLPVTLSSFTVSAVMNSYINVEWSTASESQLNCFNVWRDGEIIGSVEATNTTQTQFYSFTDHQTEPGNTYHYWLEVVELDGSTTMFGPQSVTLEQQGEPGQPAIPQVYGLYQNYPNPFNPSTEISFSVPGTTTGELVVYACNGQLVKRLYQGRIDAQEVYRITWDGTDSSGKSVASGLYFYRLQTEKASLHKKMILIQ